jgi:hypothetical protein
MTSPSFLPNVMSRFLKLTAIIEVLTGLGLLVVPAIVVRLLLNSEISGAALPLGRVAGVALLALGVACWLASNDTPSSAARGLVSAMLLYNIGATLILGAAGLGSGLVGLILWPAVLVHAGMAIWCTACLGRSPQTP